MALPVARPATDDFGTLIQYSHRPITVPLGCHGKQARIHFIYEPICGRLDATHNCIPSLLTRAHLIRNMTDIVALHPRHTELQQRELGERLQNNRERLFRSASQNAPCQCAN